VTAEKTHLSSRHFQDIETGRRPGIRLATVERIAKVFKVEAWELLQPERFPEPKNQRGRSRPKVMR